MFLQALMEVFGFCAIMAAFIVIPMLLFKAIDTVVSDYKETERECRRQWR